MTMLRLADGEFDACVKRRRHQVTAGTLRYMHWIHKHCYCRVSNAVFDSIALYNATCVSQFHGCENGTLRMEKRIVAAQNVALFSRQPSQCRALESFYFPGAHAVWHHTYSC